MTLGRRMALRRRRLGLFVFVALAVLLVAGSAPGQIVMRSVEALPSIDAAQRAAIVDSVTTTLSNVYVFEDVAREMENHVRGQLKRGQYDDMETLAEFTRALTEDLRSISNDRHLSVAFLDPASMAEALQEEEDAEVSRTRQLERLRRDNFMFREVKLLEGNVGYLRLDAFVGAELSGPTATAAMNFLGNCDALIIDLRQNGGGDPSLIQYLTAYLLDESTHLNSFENRREASIHQFWTAPYVPGPKLADVPVFVLTSQRTFSGAEEFTYNLKSLERATIVGETSGGGAHPVQPHHFPSLGVQMYVPYARALNPITGTNWEGTGIAPHIECGAPAALDVAHLEALRGVREKETDPDRIVALDWAIGGLTAKFHPTEIDAATLERYAGTYEDRRLWVEDGRFFYQRGDGAVLHPVPMTERLFRFDEIEYFRLEIVLDDAGDPVKLIGHYHGGRTDESPRTD